MIKLTNRISGAVLAAGALLAVSAADVRAQALEKLTGVGRGGTVAGVEHDLETF